MSLLESQVVCGPRKKKFVLFHLYEIFIANQHTCISYPNQIIPNIPHRAVEHASYTCMQLYWEKTITKHDFLIIQKIALIFLSSPKQNRIQTTPILASRAYGPRWILIRPFHCNRFRVFGPIFLMLFVTVVYLRE